MEDYKEEYELGSIVTAKRTYNGETITGEFAGFYLLDKSNPKSIVGVVHTPNGSYDVEPNSIESVIGEDEKIRKGIIEYLEQSQFGEEHYIIDDDIVRCYIAWLKKQGKQKQNVIDIISDLENYFATTTKEQQEEDWNELRKWEEKYFNHDKHIENSSNKAEPKFKVGDYIINKYGFIMQIDGIDGNMYVYHVLDDNGKRLTYDITKTDKSCHLWTIQDAKDGDVLYTPKWCGVECIFIVGNWKEINGTGRTLCSNITYRVEDDEIISGGLGAIWWEGVVDPYYPATKEQRDLLFQKMKEAWYEWDAEKKELNKIEQKSAWSEEDENMFSGLNSIVEDWYNTMSEKEKEYYGDCGYIDWLKSLKERLKGE